MTQTLSWRVTASPDAVISGPLNHALHIPSCTERLRRAASLEIRSRHQPSAVLTAVRPNLAAVGIDNYAGHRGVFRPGTVLLVQQADLHSYKASSRLRRQGSGEVGNTWNAPCCQC